MREIQLQDSSAHRKMPRVIITLVKGGRNSLLFSSYLQHIEYSNINRFIIIFVLYCIDGVVIAAQCTVTFVRSIALPEFGY
jgi:hypothetical protein